MAATLCQLLRRQPHPLRTLDTLSQYSLVARQGRHDWQHPAARQRYRPYNHLRRQSIGLGHISELQHVQGYLESRAEPRRAPRAVVARAGVPGQHDPTEWVELLLVWEDDPGGCETV